MALKLRFTPNTRLDLPRANLDLRTLQILEPIAISGCPRKVSPELAAAITELVCQSINPLRPFFWNWEDQSC